MNTRLEYAAILLLGVGADNAAEILKQMTPDEVQKLGVIMRSIQNIEREQLQSVIQSFVADLEQQTGLGAQTDDFVKNMMQKALGREKADSIYNKIQLGIEASGLDELRWMAPNQVADIIETEHPQVKAMILSYLDEERAAAVLTELGADSSVGLLQRLATMTDIQPETLNLLNQSIEKKLATQKSQASGANFGGPKNVANILNHLNKDAEQKALDGLMQADPDIGQKVKELMFVFPHLIQADNKSLQRLIQKIESDKLALALRDASDELQEKFFANMSTRASERLKESIAETYGVKLSEVEAAQKDIIQLAATLIEADEFTLLRGGDELI